MPRTEPHLAKDYKMTAKNPINVNMNDRDMYDRTGLWLILKLFHYFGFRLLNDPAQESCVNKIQASVVFSIACIIYIIGSYIRSHVLINNDGSVDYENAGYFAVIGFTFTAAIISYALGLRKAKEYSVLMRSLASAIDSIPDQERRRRIIRGFKRSFFLLFVPYVVGGCALGMATVFYNHLWLNSYAQKPKVFFYYLGIVSTINMVWTITVSAFYLFTNALLLTVCGILNAIINVYLESEVDAENQVKDLWASPNQWDGLREEEMTRNIIHHKKMSMIVKKANSVFANFLLLTLAVEITICIVYVKMITIKDGTFSFGSYINSPHIVLLILKAFACGNVNDTLKSSLLLNKLPDQSNFSNEQVNYLLYMEEQNISKAELTYGNIFAVTKTFIFTIAGTALTYALVLQGMNQSS